LPGVVTHSTNVIEHPEVVADRIERWANVVGVDSLVASTDCGLGGRVHPQVAWAKLKTLGEGAALASKRLRAAAPARKPAAKAKKAPARKAKASARRAGGRR
jgi:hypothetical protein